MELGQARAETVIRWPNRSQLFVPQAMQFFRCKGAGMKSIRIVGEQSSEFTWGKVNLIDRNLMILLWLSSRSLRSRQNADPRRQNELDRMSSLANTRLRIGRCRRRKHGVKAQKDPDCGERARGLNEDI